MPKDFSAEIKAEAEALLKRYPEPQAALLPVLHLAEKDFGVVDSEAEALAASLCGVTKIRVHEVWSFYHMYARQPRGKYHIRVCHNLSCSLLGAESIIEYLQKALGLEGEGTTEDGLFSLERVECLGACGGAPSMLVNEELYENMTEEKLDKLIRDFRDSSGNGKGSNKGGSA